MPPNERRNHVTLADEQSQRIRRWQQSLGMSCVKVASLVWLFSTSRNRKTNGKDKWDILGTFYFSALSAGRKGSSRRSWPILDRRTGTMPQDPQRPRHPGLLVRARASGAGIARWLDEAKASIMRSKFGGEALGINSKRVTAMPEIVVDERQARIISEATSPVEIRDPQGRLLATIEPLFTAAEIAEARQRLHSNSPVFSSEEVRTHLRELEAQ